MLLTTRGLLSRNAEKWGIEAGRILPDEVSAAAVGLLRRVVVSLSFSGLLLGTGGNNQTRHGLHQPGLLTVPFLRSGCALGVTTVPMVNGFSTRVK